MSTTENTTMKVPNLKRSRTAKELSQPALAKKAGVTTYVIAVAEQHNRPIQKSEAEKLAKALGVKLPSLQG